MCEVFYIQNLTVSYAKCFLELLFILTQTSEVSQSGLSFDTWIFKWKRFHFGNAISMQKSRFYFEKAISMQKLRFYFENAILLRNLDFTKNF